MTFLDAPLIETQAPQDHGALLGCADCVLPEVFWAIGRRHEAAVGAVYQTCISCSVVTWLSGTRQQDSSSGLDGNGMM